MWDQYTKEYSEQLAQIKGIDGQDFFISRFEDHSGDIVFFDNLHSNWKEIYATAYRLKPSNIFEAGCGGCYHVKNLNTILPGATVFGCDLLQSQLDFGRKFSDLSDEQFNRLTVCNLLKDVPAGKYDFVFTQAVVMHLSTNNAVAFLRSLASIASKYILLVEGVRNHAGWYDLVKSTLPEFEFSTTSKYIDYGVFLVRK